jgi:hypothetical protein
MVIVRLPVRDVLANEPATAQQVLDL